MTSPLWPIKPHTAAKHSIFRRYLEAWFLKLAWTRRLLIVDGFAGPGEYSGGEPGSPRIAIEVAKSHQANLGNCEVRFLFVEADDASFEHLAEAMGAVDLPDNIRADTVHGEFNETMTLVLDAVEDAGKRLDATFVMVDPFGPKGLPLRTLQRIGRHPKSELLVSLMYEPISRWLSTPEFEPHLDALYGTHAWATARSIGSPNQRREFMLNLYVSQLKSEVGMAHVSAFALRDEGNRVEYFLIHGTHSLDGLRAMKEAMWKVDPESGVGFSDATAGRGAPLFQLAPDFNLLKSQIRGEFTGKEAVSVEDIEYFVLTQTAFRETHFKRQILKPMEDAGELSASGDAKRRKGTFPAGTRVSFR